MVDGIPLRPDQFTSTQERDQSLAHDGSPAPEDSVPHTVEKGDWISKIMAEHGLSYPEDLDVFYEYNPQFAPSGDRDIDLIFPGEVIYLPADATGGPDGDEATPVEQDVGVTGAESPPTNGTTSTSNADGTATYQNHQNGYPVGPPYTAYEAANGNPVNGTMVDANGGMIRTDAQGNPATGWVPVAGNPGSPITYAYYVDGRPVKTDTVIRDDGTPPPSPPDRVEEDFAGEPIGTGWYPVNGSSSGASYAYFVDGQRIDAPTVTSPPVDGSPPNIAPPAPQNGTVMVSGPDQSGNATFQSYRDGEPLGDPFQAPVADNGMPKNHEIVNVDGGAVMTGSDGQPVTGWVGESGAAGVEQTYTYYVNGMPTTSTHEGTEPPAEPPEPTETDYANKPVDTGWYVVNGSSQGVLMGYYIDGHRIDVPTTVNGSSDDPPPQIPPAEPGE